MANFNVLTEPWINVVTLEGKRKEMGIYEIFKNAHELKSINEDSPLFEYGIYRILIAFVMDIFRPQMAKDINNIINGKEFSMDIIDKYLEDCQQDYNCFDLFDEQKPFLQSAYDSKYDKAPKSVASLIHDIPSGNNHVHFRHPIKDEAFCPAVCAKALCAIYIFCVAGLQGPSSINGAPPLFTLVEGENLFETLVYNSMTVRTSNLEYDTPSVAWRNTNPVIPGQEVAITSVLEAMTWMPRRITLIPEETGGVCALTGRKSNILVKNIYLQKGRKFIGYSSWKDPHVCYDKKKDKTEETFSLKPQLSKNNWRNLDRIFCKDNTRATVVSQYADIQNVYRNGRDLSEEEIAINVYGLVTSQASYLDWCSDRFPLNKVLLEADKAASFIFSIDMSEEVARFLRISLNKSVLREGRKGPRGRAPHENLVEQSMAEYFNKLEEYLLNDYMDILKTESDDNKARKLAAKKIQGTAVNQYELFSDRVAHTTKYVIICAKQKEILRRTINKFYKGRGLIEA